MIHICYLTPAGYMCTCGENKHESNSQLAFQSALGHVAPYVHKTTTHLIDLQKPARDFFKQKFADERVNY